MALPRLGNIAASASFRIAAATQRGKPREMPTDPYISFRFRAEIDSLQVSGFSEVTGLAFESEVQTFREGGDNLQEAQLPGPTKFPSRLVMKRGLADADRYGLGIRK